MATCEHSPKTWTPTEEFWTWRCPVCGLVDGFTAEVISEEKNDEVRNELL